MGFQEMKRRNRALANMDLLSLPTKIIHTILKDLCQSDFPDLIRARSVCKGLQEVADSEEFLRDVDIIAMTGTTTPAVAAAKFTKVCFLNGNASAVFEKGVNDFFKLGRLEEDLERIRVAAERGYDLVLYVYAMLDRILNWEQPTRSQLTQLPRDFFRRMNKKVAKLEDVMFPVFDKHPAIYDEKVAMFDWDDLFSCGSCVWRHNPPKTTIWGTSCDKCFIMEYILLFRRVFPWKVRLWVTLEDLKAEETEGPSNCN